MVLFNLNAFALWILLIYLDKASGYPEQGLWNFELNGYNEDHQSVVVTKSMFGKGFIITGIQCNPADNSLEDFNLEVTWYLRKTTCWKEYFETGPVAKSPKEIFQVLERTSTGKPAIYTTDSEIIPCDGKMIYLSVPVPAANLLPPSDISLGRSQKAARDDAENESENIIEPNVQSRRRKRAVEEDLSTLGSTAVTKGLDHYDTLKGIKPEKPSLLSTSGAAKKEPLYIVPSDGIYQFIIGRRVQHLQSAYANESYNAILHIEMVNDYGYLSAADYPLLVFYSTMCVIYVIFGMIWLVISFMRWRELLRVQYWIGAVILLGMLEKAVFTAEYESVNKKGVSVPGLIVFAELVSCAKRTLSRMLVIIVSFGFGIVKPRLGIVLHRVIGAGALYFLLASIEGCMRALRPKLPNDEYSRRLLFAIIPLALLESAICWWVFSALVSTTRTLRLRRNTIKLNLFKHFTNTLIFVVITSVIFMLWSIKYRNFDNCLSDWKQLWVNDAFWHVLFAIILLVIMILWRPTNNNQRFAFSPLLDEGSDGEEEEQEKLMTNIAENMKYRNQRNSSTSPSPRHSQSLEDDLKWVEENIPSSLADTGLPIMDSDEEILTTRFEISKMQ